MRLALYLSHFTHEDMRQSKVKWLAQGHRVWKWQTWILKSCNLALEFIPSAAILYCLSSLKTVSSFPPNCVNFIYLNVWTLSCLFPLLSLWNKSTSPLICVTVIALYGSLCINSCLFQTGLTQCSLKKNTDIFKKYTNRRIALFHTDRYAACDISTERSFWEIMEKKYFLLTESQHGCGNDLAW